MRPSRGVPWRPGRPSQTARRRVTAAWSSLIALICLTPAAPAVQLVGAEVTLLEVPDFVEPNALAANAFGALFVCDVGRGAVVSLDADARVRFEFESPATQPDLQPVDVEVTGFQVYVIDAVSNNLLRFSDRGSFLDVLQSFTERRLETPSAISVDAAGRVLIANPATHAVALLDETQAAETVVGGFGARPGEFNAPSGVAFAPDGSFYVSDTANARVQLFSGVGNWVTTLAASMREPRGLVVDRRGTLFVADAGGALHVFADAGRTHATLEWPDAQPIDVAVHGDTLWFLTREPAALVRVRIVRGD